MKVTTSPLRAHRPNCKKEKMGHKPARDIDKAIIDTLEELGLATPALVAGKIKRDRRYVANRLSYLVSIGLAKKAARGVYKALKVREHVRST